MSADDGRALVAAAHAWLDDRLHNCVLGILAAP